jgi:hypothetical protein
MDPTEELRNRNQRPGRDSNPQEGNPLPPASQTRQNRAGHKFRHKVGPCGTSCGMMSTEFQCGYAFVLFEGKMSILEAEHPCSSSRL